MSTKTKLVNIIKNVTHNNVPWVSAINGVHELSAILRYKQETKLSKEILERNGFEILDVDYSDFSYPFVTWQLKDNYNFWFDEYTEDFERNSFNVKKNSFITKIGNKKVEIKTIADLEDILELCGIEKEIDLTECLISNKLKKL